MLSHSHIILKCPVKKIFPTSVGFEPSTPGCKSMLHTEAEWFVGLFLQSYISMYIFQLMDWPCSKSVQSLGQTAFVVQNKNQNKTSLDYVVRNFSAELQKVRYHALFMHWDCTFELSHGNGRVNFRDVPHCLEQVEEETYATK